MAVSAAIKRSSQIRAICIAQVSRNTREVGWLLLLKSPPRIGFGDVFIATAL